MALRITMEEPGAIMAISLRQVASPGNAMDVTGLVRGRDFTSARTAPSPALCAARSSADHTGADYDERPGR